MRSGRFEPEPRPDGKRLFRLRWDVELDPLDAADRRRLEFLRYLLHEGRIGDGVAES